MDKFGIKKAIQAISDGNTVTIVSEDFKTHLFYKSKNKFNKPIVHTVRRSIGRPLDLQLTWDEFKEKFGDKLFYIFDK